MSRTSSAFSDVRMRCNVSGDISGSECMIKASGSCRRTLSPRKFTDQVLLKSQFAQRQREMAPLLDDNNSPLVFSAIMDFVKNCAQMVRCSGIYQVIL